MGTKAGKFGLVGTGLIGAGWAAFCSILVHRFSQHHSFRWRSNCLTPGRIGGTRRRVLEMTFAAEVGVTAAGYVRNPRRRRAGLRLARLPRFACAAGPGPGLRSPHDPPRGQGAQDSRLPHQRRIPLRSGCCPPALSNNARSRKYAAFSRPWGRYYSFIALPT